MPGRNASDWLREPPFLWSALGQPIADASLTSSHSGNDRRVSDSDKCWGRVSGPLLASTVECDLAINNDRHEPVAFCVLELHDLTTAASQLSPSARFLRILLDGFVFVALNTECGGFQMLSTCAARSMDTFLALYTKITKDDIRRNRNNAAERLGFLGRVIHGTNPRAWLKEVTQRIGEGIDYAPCMAE